MKLSIVRCLYCFHKYRTGRLPTTRVVNMKKNWEHEKEIYSTSPILLIYSYSSLVLTDTYQTVVAIHIRTGSKKKPS